MPLAVKAVDVYGGSEVETNFGKICQRRYIKLLALPPRSPKLNGVEGFHRTHTTEFYEVIESSFVLSELRD